MLRFLSHKKNIIIAMFCDFFLLCISWYSSFYLRFNFNLPEFYFNFAHTLILYILSMSLIIFIATGIYKISWRYISTIDVLRISFTLLLILFFLFAIFPIFSINIPNSILLINFLVSIVLIGGIRFSFRIFTILKSYKFFVTSKKKIIFYGCNRSVQILLDDFRSKGEFHVVGVLDDDVSLHGKRVFGVSVLGSLDYLNNKMTEKIDQLIITLPNPSDNTKKKLMTFVNRYEIKVLDEPSRFQPSGSPPQFILRNFNLDDLLGREPIDIRSIDIKMSLAGKIIFISGAGGSIGRELAKQVLQYKPKLLICLDISEFGLYNLQQNLSVMFKHSNIKYLVADIKNSKRISSIFSQHSPNVVFHAAAYKHVPLLEDNNLVEAFSNNVVGTYNLCEVSIKHKVTNFTLVSTDKAVNPTNIMGASKRMAELVSLSFLGNHQTKINIVRFGNVLGSSGSVIPLFRKQIESGGPLTITDKRITRYFMSIPEACGLILQSNEVTNSGNIYILDMGKPISILDLANNMIRLSGIKGETIKIKYIGLRPGEKLFEELSLVNEKLEHTEHPQINTVKSNFVPTKKIKNLILWINSLENKDESDIRREILNWVPEYKNLRDEMQNE